MKEDVTPKKKRRIGLKIFCCILALIIVFVGASAIVSVIGDKANTKKALTFESVAYEEGERLEPEKDEKGNWTFTTDDEFKVLQLTDVHIGGGWMSLKKDSMAINAVAAMVTAEKPDLIIVTGDIAYPVPFQAGTFNNLASAKIFAQLMEKLGVYWTLVFGNHDTEAYSFYSREKISDFYENSGFKHCLYQSGPADVDGSGNQIINIKKTNGVLTQSLYLFDSHSYTGGDFLGILWKYDNIHENQVQWYKTNVEAYNAQNEATYKELGLEGDSTVKSTAFFHIPLTEMRDAWYEYAENGFKDTDDVTYVYGDAGESSKVVYCGIGDDNLFETMQELGSTKAVFCGHDHKNNFSIDYKGIRLTYGMAVDYLAYPGIYKLGAQRGCTTIQFYPNGTFDCQRQSYYQPKYVSLYDKEEVEMQTIEQVSDFSEYKD